MSMLRSFEANLSPRINAPMPHRPASTLLRITVATTLLAASLPGTAALSQSQVLSALDHTVDTPLNIVDERFGKAVAVSGNWMAVGSPAAGNGQGSVSIYERVSGNWTWRQRVMQPTAQASSGFGSAVDIHEAGGLVTVIVGAPQFDLAETSQGRAYIFSDTNAGSALSFSTVTLNSPTAELNGHFGASVALFADLAAVGAPNTGASDDGLVSIRGRNVGGSNAWGQVVPPKTGPAGARFGTSVDLHGEYLIVGAPLAENVAAIRTGLAYVYRQDLGGVSAWGLKHSLAPALGQAGQVFGQSVGVWDSNLGVADSSSRSMVGAPLFDDAGDIDAGRVTFFSDATNTGQFQGIDPNEQYGYSVALEAADAIAGRPTRPVGGQSNAGQVNTFSFNGTGWVTNTINLAETGASRNHFFGWSVDISATHAVIGTPGTLADALNAPPGAARAGSITTLVKPGATWTLDPKTLATYDQPFSQSNQFFGLSTAVTSQWMAVGAQRDGQKGADAGAVFMYRYVAGLWTPHSKLTALFGKAGDQFGTAVTLQGGRLVVGAPGADGFPGATSNAGAVYVYEFNGTAWVQRLERQSPNPTAEGLFGVAVSLHGDVLAVGAGGENGNIGRAYAFRDLVGLSSPITLDVAASVASGAGRSVSVYDPSPGTPNDESIAIGAFADNAGGGGAGAAYVRTGPSFATVTPLANPAPGTNRFFGHSVALFNGRVAVGAPTSTAAPSGAAYVFSGPGYSDVETLAPAGSPGQFGFAVALDDSQVLVGSPASNGRAGLAHVFQRSGSAWAQTDLLQPADLAALDEFGSSVAMSGGSFAVASPVKESVVVDSGVVYVFQQAPEVLVSPTALSLSETGSTSSSFSVRLSTAPSSNVTIALTFPSAQVQVDTGSGFGISPQTVTLTPANASTGVTVSLRAVDDAIVEADPHATTLVTADTVSSDSAYNNLPVAEIDVSIADNDSAGVRITQSGSGTTVGESGTTDAYTIVLDSQPSATVNVAVSFPATDLTVSGDTDGTYNTSFTTANWNTPQTITVAAVNDRNFEGNHTGGLVHSFTSADPIYDSITAQVDGTTATNTLTASITDNETVELRWVNATGSAAEGATYIQNVVMDITADPVGGTPQNEVAIAFEAPITFITAAAADIQIQFIAQTISAGNNDGQQYSVFHDFVGDSLIEGPETFSMAINATTPYPGLTVGTNHTATILEGSAATASIATTSLAIGEDIGTFSIPVTLNVSPNAALSEPATVVVQLDDGTAAFNGAVGDMYFDNAGTPANSIVVTFPAGSDNGDIVNAVVTILDDQTAESSPASPVPFNINEQFSVTLGATTGVLSAATGTTAVTIDENDFAYITVNAPSITVNESDGTITQNLRVRMVTFGTGPQQLQAAATVPLQNATFGSAVAPDDYTAITTSVTIPAGALNNSLHPFQVSIVDDDIDEIEEFGDVGIVTGSYSGVPIIVPPSANNNCNTTVNPGLTPPNPCRNRMTMRILDNDTAGIVVSQSGGTTAVIEGGINDGYSVVLGSQPTSDVTVNLAFDAAQLIINGDTDGTTSLTFTPSSWSVAQTVNVVAVDDTLVEANPHSSLIVQTASSADALYNVINPADVLVSITENDLQEITFSAASSTAAENGTHAVNARLSIISNGTPGGTITSDMTANVSVALGSAEAGDFTLTTTSVTFPAGSAHNSTLPISIDITDDRILEDGEDFTLSFTLVSATGAVSGTHQVTITDNETANLAFTTLSQNFAESVGNATTAVELVITGSGSVGAAFTTENAVNVQITDTAGTAANPADYTLTTTSLTFPAGTVSGTALNVTTAIVSDLAYEIDESYSLSFGTVTASGTVTSGIAHTATIVDDETVSFVLAPASISVAESAGTHTSTVAMTVTGTGTGTAGIQNAFVIPVLYTEVTANEPEDFTVGAGSVTFTAGATSGATQTITVGILDDDIDEADEDFVIFLDASAAAPDILFGNASTFVTITDDDAAGITVTQSGGTTAVAEGGTQDSYDVVLASQPSGNVTVTLAFDTQVEISTDGVNFTPSPVVLIFTPGNWNTIRSLVVQAVNDTVVEGSHTALIEHTVSSADAIYNAINPADVNVSISDNDTAEVIFSSAGFAAIEGAVFSPGMTLKLTANGAPGGSIAGPVVVDLGFTPLTATADDVSIATAQATFPAGSTHDTVVMTHSITVVDDPVVEESETFELDLSIASGLATTTASNTYTITDNDSATVGFAPISVSQSEAASPMTFTVTLSNPVASGVTVTVNSTNGTAGAADFTAISGDTVSFPANSITPQTVNVSINNDALDEDDESFTLALSNPVAAGAVTLGTATATGTIQDDDALPALSVANISQPEGDAVNTLAFTVNLSAVSGRAVSFTGATVDGTAISSGPNADFVAVPAGPITIPAGATSVTLPVTINGDTVFEGDESFSLNLTAVNNASPGTLSATATLQDDDQEATTTEITSDEPDPSAVNAPYTVQVTVRGQTLAPAGTVTVDDGTGVSCGPVTLVAGTAPASSASCAITSTTPGTKTLTATYAPASTAFAVSSDTELHTVVVVAPEVAYAPTTGTTVNFTGISTIGSIGSGTIVATPSGGADTGAAATTTINSCSLGGANPANFAGAAAINLSFVGNTTTPQTLALSCSAATTIQTATLTCNETRGTAAPVPREWPLSCPAGALLPLTSTPAVGGTVSITGPAGGSTATRPITLINPNLIGVSLTCAAPAFPFTAAPLTFSIPAGSSAAVNVGIASTAAGNFTGTLSCTVAGSPQVLTFNLSGSLMPAIAVNASSAWSLIALMLALFGFAAVALRRLS
jgi:hypothetical protein